LLTLLVLVLLSKPVTGTFLWDFTQQSPFDMLVLGYGGYALIMLLAFVLPFMQSLSRAAPLIEIAFLSLLSLLSKEQSILIFPLYLFPLASLAVRTRPVLSLGGGSIAALLFFATAITGHLLMSEPPQSPDYVLLGLMSMVLIALPWMVSSLAQSWSSSNRQSMEEIVRQAQEQQGLAEQRAQSAQQRLLTLTKLVTELVYHDSSLAEQKRVLNLIVEEGVRVLGVSHALLLKRTDDPENPGEFLVVAGHALNPLDAGNVCTIEPQGTIDKILQPGTRPHLLQDISQDVDLQRFATLHSCRSAWVAPLQHGVTVDGALIFASDHQEGLQKAQEEVVVMLAHLASIDLYQGSLLHELEPQREQLLTCEARARQDLTRHVHDGLAQTLAQIVMNTDILKRMVKEDPSAASGELEKLHEQFRRYHFEVREVLTALSPLPLGQGLYDVLHNFLERKRGGYKQTRIILEADSIKNLALHYTVENMLYNIVQEAVNNALKYAEATNIWVRLKLQEHHLLMTITDDGKGFDVEKGKEAARKRGSFGLFNIGERARLVGGSAEIYAKIGKGTFIRVYAPLTGPERDENEQ
jgi:signal transduction histidine kinase